MKKTKKSPVPAKAVPVIEVPKRIVQADYGKFRPKRKVPGVIGRTEWFVERAGMRSGALSLERLMRATELAETLLSADELRKNVAEIAATFLAAARTKKQNHAALAFDGAGKTVRVRAKAGRKKAGITAIGGPVEVADFATYLATAELPAVLVIPVDDRATAELDLSEVIVADVSDPRHPRLDQTFSYLPQEAAIVGRVLRPGLYQAFAMPKHPWVQAAFKTLGLHWKWVQFDPALRKLAGGGKDIGGPLVDRICQLILCPSVYQVEAGELFDRMGVGEPPGGFGGGGGQNICERCLGDFLGELDIDLDDGRIIPPPVIGGGRLHRAACSQWESVGPYPSPGFQGIGRVTQLDMHPTNGNTLIAGAAGGGVWRTDNAGITWRPLMELQPTLTIGAVAFAPSNPAVIYAASGEDADGFGPAWPGVGIYRSDDHGVHWRLMTSIASNLFSAIVVHPTDPNTIYAAGNRGLHKSRDGGVTWLANAGLGSLFDGNITDVVIAHDDPERIYIGVRNNGVFRSTSGGQMSGGSPAFTRLDGAGQLPSGANAGWIKLAIGRSGADGTRFLVTKLGPDGRRIFTTTNRGTTWTERAADVAVVGFDEWCSVIAVDPRDQNILYAGAAGTLQRTTNGGATAGDWTSIATGIHPDQQDLVCDPREAGRIFLANDGGVYRSTNRGTAWTFTSGDLRITQFYDIDISEKDPDIVAGGAQDNGVYYRNAAGVWTHIPWGDGTQTAIDPTDPRIFYFSSQNGLPSFLRRSLDGGASHVALGTAGLSGGSPWVTIIKLEPRDPIASPASNRVLFVCGTSQLFRSTNGGTNWQRVNDAAGNAFTTDGAITALEFALGDLRILYLGTSSGSLYRGINGGVSAGDWTRIDTVGSSADPLFPNVQIQSLAVSPRSANDVWVVFGGAGVNSTSRPGSVLNPLGISHLFRTTDGGANWSDASGRFAAMSLPDVPTSAVALDDVDADLAYVGSDVGVFRTTDGGTTWTAFQDGLPRSPVTELKFNRAQNRLYAGTMGRGAYVREV